MSTAGTKRALAPSLLTAMVTAGSLIAPATPGGDGGAFITYDGRNDRVVEKRWIR